MRGSGYRRELKAAAEGWGADSRVGPELSGLGCRLPTGLYWGEDSPNYSLTAAARDGGPELHQPSNSLSCMGSPPTLSPAPWGRFSGGPEFQLLLHPVFRGRVNPPPRLQPEARPYLDHVLVDDGPELQQRLLVELAAVDDPHLLEEGGFAALAGAQQQDLDQAAHGPPLPVASLNCHLES
uniref:Uncharacterized protein n=1 Tax=Gopherus agassizii TaxID=38772 RepID=A0A452IR57_9SAUR